jgi:predicted aspartyl protease
MKFVMHGALALAFTLGFAAPVAAECNKPLTLVTTVDLAPVRDMRAVLIPVTLAGKPKRLLVDTGGAMTEITPEVADELQLPRQRTAYQLFDVSGKMSNQYVHVSLQLGRLSTDNIAMMVAPPGQKFGDDMVAGVLAPDVLRHYDVDIDFVAGKFNLLSQDHCEGKVVYWKADALAVVPMRVMDSGHIMLPVLLDGKEVQAILDTGAANSTLSEPIAESEFGLKPGSPDVPATGTLIDRPSATTYHHVFKSLGFEGIAVTNPDIDIIPDFTKQIAQENATPELGSHIVGVKSNETQQSMLLGMNILRHFHIYIAYKENRVYITPATSAAPAGAADAPVAAAPAH